ncbi:MAG: DUF4198 domain-containing protein [Bryobacterales bacterium]|nr:DUF4198 domain-containing protein [Bryobacterales bacterium]
MRLPIMSLLIPTALFGHDLYLKPAKCVTAPGETVRVEYHSGDAFPVSQNPVVLSRLKDARRISATGDAAFTGIHDESKTLTVAGFTAPAKGHFWLLSRTEPNFIELDARKFEEYLEHEGLKYVSEWRKKNGESDRAGKEIYSKYVKSLLVTGAGDGWFNHAAGLAIEFVPLDDPYAAKPGAAIRVQLLFRGKPAAGHEVELQTVAAGKADRKILGNTDAQGVVRVPLAPGGFHKLHAIVMERRADRTKADWESWWATLTFGTR